EEGRPGLRGRRAQSREGAAAGHGQDDRAPGRDAEQEDLGNHGSLGGGILAPMSPVKIARSPAPAELRARGPIPKHVAIIMDGNGRWAARRGVPRLWGHRAGRRSVRECIEASLDLGVEILTLYTFSRENWERPRREVQGLMRFLVR